MELYSKKVSVVAIFNAGELPIPYKFKTTINEERLTIQVDQIIEIKRLYGSIFYNCRSELYGVYKDYWLSYKLNDMQWSVSEKATVYT